MKTEIAIIKDRKVFRIEAPPETKIFQGDRALNVDFDIVSVNRGASRSDRFRIFC